MFASLSFKLAVCCLPLLAHAQYSATYLPSTAPKTTEEGQAGTNQCGTGNSQDSSCQNVYINSVDDFCLFAPPAPGANATIGDTERIEVSWCIKPGYGTRLIPDGAITGAHFVQTPDFVQVTGVGNLTLMNIPAGDSGGELDPHGADGNGNPIGGLVFSSAFGDLEQIHEWTNFMSAEQFCIRACNPGPKAPEWCQHIYDVMGCQWNMPGNYDSGVFEKCKGDSGEPMGVYGASTFRQGEPSTPDAHPIPSSSMCTTISSIGNFAVSTTASTSASTSGSSSSGGSSSSPTHTSSSSSGKPDVTGSSQKNSAISGHSKAADNQRVLVVMLGIAVGALMVL